MIDHDHATLPSMSCFQDKACQTNKMISRTTECDKQFGAFRNCMKPFMHIQPFVQRVGNKTE